MLAGAGAAFVNQHRDTASIRPGPAGLNAPNRFAELVSAWLPPEINAANDRFFDEAAIDLVRQLIAAAAISPNVNDEALSVFQLFERLVKLRDKVCAAPA